MSQSEPLVLIVSGPSGSGKSTLVQKILELPDTMLAVSSTTRAPRRTESAGKWYNFVSEAQFQGMVARGEFLEYAQVFGKNWYGTPRTALDEALANKKDLVLEIDVQGALQVRQKLPGAVAIFVIPPSRDAELQQLRFRRRQRRSRARRP
jgi:guanylate kinase